MNDNLALEIQPSSFFLNILNGITDPIFVKDRQHRWIFLNDAFCQLMSRSRTEMLGKSDYDFFSQGEADIFWQKDELVFTTGVDNENEEYFTDAQGNSYLIYTKKSLFIDESGKQFLVGIIRRIFAKGKIEQELRESKQLLQLVMDNIPQSIFWKDRNSNYLGCNRKFAKDAGVNTPEELIGKNDYDLPWTKQESDWYRECDRRVIESDIPELGIVETQQQTNGKQIWVETNKIPLHDINGKVIGILGTYEDITLRKQTEVALQNLNDELENRVNERTETLKQTVKKLKQEIQQRQEIEKKLQLAQYAIDNTSESLFLILDNAKIGYANQAACHTSGYTLAELLSLSVFALDPNFSAENWAQHWQQVKQQGSMLIESYYQTKNGDIYPAEIAITHLKFDEQEYNFVRVRDISERHEAEAKLKEQLQLLAFRADVDTALSHNDTLSTILSNCTEAVVTHLDAAFARIWTLNTAENILELQASSGLYTHINGDHARVPVGMFKIGLIAEEKQPHLTNSVLTDPRVGNKEWAKQEGMVAFAGYPLIVDTELVGVIAMFSRHKLPNSVLKALEFAANEIAIGIKRKQAEAALQISESSLRQQAEQLQQTLKNLQQAQTQLIQTEKMSSLGQLVAGVAHEINNPINFIHGNLIHANDYIDDLIFLLECYQEYHPNPHPEVTTAIEERELDFLLEDLPKLLSSMKVGTNRIREIVSSLRTFSRLDEAEVKAVNIHEGIDSTLMILHHRLKAKSDRSEIKVIKNYGNLPSVECYAGQLNQVFMNIITNAIDALEDKDSNNLEIKISTEVIDSAQIMIKIADNGLGMPESVKNHIFDPFYTTKSVGKGTGLGMSISYQIITEKHSGLLNCVSVLGEGTEFQITIPIKNKY